MSEKTKNINIFKEEIVKDILRCFKDAATSQLRFSEIQNGLPDNPKKKTHPDNKRLPPKKYYDMQIDRNLKKMLSFGILHKNGVYYQLTDTYMVEVRRAQLSQLIDSYPPEDVMDYSKSVFLGLPNEVYRPDKHELPSKYFDDLYIKPEDIFREESEFVKRRKEMLKDRINNLIEDYKNKTKAEVLEILKENMLSQVKGDLSLKYKIPPYEACERIVRKLVEGRNKYRLSLIQDEYDLQLHNITEGEFKQYMFDYREYFTHKLNLIFMHFFKTGRHLKKDRYENFENKYDFESTLRLFYNMDDFESRHIHFWNMVEKPPMYIACPHNESISKRGIEILKFLSTIVQNVNEQTNDRYVKPLTIVSTSFRAVVADKEFWENDEKIRKIIKHQQS